MSKSEHGEIVAIYVLGPIAGFVDYAIGAHGETAMCASVGEDYAKTDWPIVVKVKPTVPRDQIVQHLRDLADAIDQRHLFISVGDIRQCRQQGERAAVDIKFGFITVD